VAEYLRVFRHVGFFYFAFRRISSCRECWGRPSLNGNKVTYKVKKEAVSHVQSHFNDECGIGRGGRDEHT
jgi:hypothetical protein